MIRMRAMMEGDLVREMREEGEMREMKAMNVSLRGREREREKYLERRENASNKRRK